MKPWMVIPILLGVAVPGPGLAQEDVTSATALVEAMRDRYPERWHTGTVRLRRVVRLAPEGRADTVLLREASAHGRLRVDFEEAGSGILHRDGLRYDFRAGELVGRRTESNPFRLLLDDVYRHPARLTMQLLDEMGFDPGTVRSGRWLGEDVWILGAADGSEAWIEKGRLIARRIVQRLPDRPVLEARMIDHVEQPGGWLVRTIEVYLDDVLVQTEELVETRTGMTIPASVFDPARWSSGIEAESLATRSGF